MTDADQTYSTFEITVKIKMRAYSDAEAKQKLVLVFASSAAPADYEIIDLRRQ